MPRPYVRIEGQRIAIQQASDSLMELISRLDTNDIAAIGAASPAAAVAADEATLLASAVRTSTQTLTDVVNTALARGALLILDVTAVTAAQTLTLEIQAKDIASGKYLTIGSTGAIGGAATLVGTYALMCYPGLTAINALLTTLFGSAVPLPYTWRARVVHSGAGNFTYSLGRSLLR